MNRTLLVYGKTCSGKTSDLNTPAALSYIKTAPPVPSHILPFESAFNEKTELTDKEELRLL